MDECDKQADMYQMCDLIVTLCFLADFYIRRWCHHKLRGRQTDDCSLSCWGDLKLFYCRPKPSISHRKSDILRAKTRIIRQTMTNKGVAQLLTFILVMGFRSDWICVHHNIPDQAVARDVRTGFCRTSWRWTLCLVLKHSVYPKCTTAVFPGCVCVFVWAWITTYFLCLSSMKD